MFFFKFSLSHFRFFISLLCKVSCITLLDDKNPNFLKQFLDDTFLFCSYFRTHPDNTTSQNIGGTDAWAVPHLKFGGDRPPSPLWVSVHVHSQISLTNQRLFQEPSTRIYPINSDLF